jgi:hypothetical protein
VAEASLAGLGGTGCPRAGLHLRAPFGELIAVFLLFLATG